MIDTTPDYARAVAAVRKWLAECERADRMSRRYGNGKFVAKVGEARETSERSFRAAVVAISSVQFGAVEVDGVRYELAVAGEEEGETYIVSSSDKAAKT